MTRLLAILFLVAALCHGSEFRQPLLIPVVYQGRELYQLVEDWPVPGYGVTVPKGSVWDGASVPRVFWFFMPPDGAHRGGALAHDFFYTLQGHLPNGASLTRKQADEAFYSLMILGGVSARRAGIAENAVRCFGGSAWRSVEAITYLPLPSKTSAIRVSHKHRTLFSHILAP